MIAEITQKRGDLSALCARFCVARLELFGSAAAEERFNSAASDLDFIVEFRSEQPLGPWLQHYFNFRDELCELFGRPVDVVMASAIKNSYFIAEANRTRIVVYGA